MSSTGPIRRRTQAGLSGFAAGDRPWLSLALACFVLGLLPLLVLAAFSQPAADDFCLFNRMVRYGFFGFNRSLYVGWTGRFASTFLYGLLYGWATVTALPWSLPFKVAAFIAVIALALSLLAVFLAWGRSFFPSATIPCALAALVFMACALATPSLFEQFYWAASSIVYTLSAAWALCLVAVSYDPAVRAERLAPARRVAHYVAAALFSIAAIGSNESIVAPVLSWLAVVAAYRFRSRAARKSWLAVLAAALVAVVVLVAAPGNYARLGVLQTEGPVRAILKTSWLLVDGIKSWITPTFVVYLAVAGLLCMRANPSLARRWPHPFVVLLGMLAVLWAMLFPAVWAYRGDVPERVMNTVCIAFTYFAFVVTLHVTVYVRDTYAGIADALMQLANNRDVKLVMLSLAIGVTAADPQFIVIWRELGSGRAQRFSQAAEARYLRAQKAGRGAVLAMPSLDDKPTTLLGNDLSADERHATNQCFALRFGLAAVRATDGDGKPSAATK